MRGSLASLRLESAFAPKQIVDQHMAQCCLSALWLAHGFLEESHSISQTVHTPTGSYWHGIMHRREEDFSNAKYWFEHVGEHSVYADLAGAARQIALSMCAEGDAAYLATQGGWDPLRFVDLCKSIRRGNTANEDIACQVARAEWQLLFDYCYQHTIGGRH